MLLEYSRGARCGRGRRDSPWKRRRLKRANRRLSMISRRFIFCSEQADFLIPLIAVLDRLVQLMLICIPLCARVVNPHSSHKVRGVYVRIKDIGWMRTSLGADFNCTQMITTYRSLTSGFFGIRARITPSLLRTTTSTVSSTLCTR